MHFKYSSSTLALFPRLLSKLIFRIVISSMSFMFSPKSSNICAALSTLPLFSSNEAQEK
ncbi:hypothetical protein X975_12965, partial [Stegodyphus mimosarum]